MKLYFRVCSVFVLYLCVYRTLPRDNRDSPLISQVIVDCLFVLLGTDTVLYRRPPVLQPDVHPELHVSAGGGSQLRLLSARFLPVAHLSLDATANIRQVSAPLVL